MKTNFEHYAHPVYGTLSCIDHGICQKDGSLILKS